MEQQENSNIGQLLFRLFDMLGIDKEQYLNTLGNVEHAFSTPFGVKDVWDYSGERPPQLGLKDSAPNSLQMDAMRHLLLSGELHRTHPQLAPFLLWAHENLTGPVAGQTDYDKKMDEYNNQLGAQIGQQSNSRQQVELNSLLAMPNAYGIKSGTLP